MAKTKPKAKVKLPDHLGGHEEMTHVDIGALKTIMDNTGITSMIDVGCGPGEMVVLARELGLRAIGVDGDFVVKRDESIKDSIFIHDFTKGPFLVEPGAYDLAWSVEFVEHIEKRYVSNYMRTFQSCKYVIMTHAFPDQPGHHHVNLRDQWYWLDIFHAFGFMHNEEATNAIRPESTMINNFMRQQSIFFENLNV